MFARLLPLIFLLGSPFVYAAPPLEACGPGSAPGSQACELPPPFPPNQPARATARLGSQWTCTAGGFTGTHPQKKTAERRAVELCEKAGSKRCTVERCVSTP